MIPRCLRRRFGFGLLGTLIACEAACAGTCARLGREEPKERVDGDARGPVLEDSSSASTTAEAKEVDARAACPPENLNVLLISVDSLRADMPWAAYPRPIAPRLTELEKHAVTYTRAYSMSSYTSMSLGGLLGGKLPGELKRDGYFFGVYAKSNLLFPELLQGAKVHTLAVHGHGYFKGAGFEQGFDAWELVPGLKWNPRTDENITSPQLEAIAEKLLSDPVCDTGRFFAWTHFMDPHDQYLPHDGIPRYGNGRTARDRYDGEVTFTDQYIGKLLDFIASKPWGRRTAIIVTADHGEAFGEHGQLAHGFELWENLVHVPLMFVVPGLSPLHIDEPRSAVDLAPTILELLGVPQPTRADAGGAPYFEGKSLVPELCGASPESRDVVVDLPATSDNDRRRSLIHGTTKIIAFGKDVSFQVFDLETDPGEMQPITRGDAFASMRARYRAFEQTVNDIVPFGCAEGCLNGAYRNKDAGN
jgi:choline-sulfatase